MRTRNSTQRILALLALAVLASGMAAGCSVPAPSPTPTAAPARPVKVAMGYIPNVQFAPFYVAQSKGYFAQEGLEVTFDYGMESDLMKLLGTGELQFVVGSGDQVILARSQGLPVVYVAQWYRRYPVCVVALAEKGIRTPQDLLGKVVGIPGLYGASYVGWKALVHATGLDETRVTLQTIGYTQVASLLEGRVDAAVCYIMNEPIQLREAGHQVDILEVSDYANLVSNGLITNEQTIQQDPDLVAALVRAFLRGLRDTLDDPESAFATCLQYVPEAGGENEARQREVLRTSVELWRTERLGASDPSAWQDSVTFMLESGLIAEAPPVEELFTNRFVEAAAVK
ncbi:MAG: ABC transporter substrate-binding protein [Anaerolineae bacterium]|nr:ABC transporter substrate-binding protein [Anaerolineae bacterium]